MVAVYSDVSHPLEDVYRQLLNFIEVYEHNGPGWVLSNFTSLQLTFRHLDPLRASAFVPLPRWIREKKAVVNITGTGDDCFKWAVLAGMHPVSGNARAHVNPDPMSTYERRVIKYDFSSLRYPVPLYSIGSFATTNNLSINVYGVENDEKVISPFRVPQTVVPDRHVDLLLYECSGIQHYTIIKNFSGLVSSQLSNTILLNIAVRNVYTATRLQNCLRLVQRIAVTYKEACSPRIQDVDLPTYISNYQHLL